MSAVLCVHEVYVSEKECCVAELCVFTCEQGYIGGLPVETVRETPPSRHLTLAGLTRPIP